MDSAYRISASRTAYYCIKRHDRGIAAKNSKCEFIDMFEINMVIVQERLYIDNRLLETSTWP